MKPQLLPLQVASAFGGSGQAVHEVVPQLLVLSFDTQLPLQSCLPAGQVPSHERPFGKHAPVPMHRKVFAGHSALHWPFWQVAVPPIGTSQGVQDVPQLLGSSFFRHPLPQA